MWFRRDLRVRDNPALLAAGEQVLPVFVFDPVLWDASSDTRRAYLVASLTSLNESLGGKLVLRTGDPTEVIPALVKEVLAAEAFWGMNLLKVPGLEDRLSQSVIALLTQPLSDVLDRF